MKVIFQKVQTRNNAIVPKMICGIIATISIVVIGFLSLSAFWFWMIRMAIPTKQLALIKMVSCSARNRGSEVKR